MAKEELHQENVIISISVPNNRAPKYMDQKLTDLKGEIDNSVIIVGKLYILVSGLGRKLGRRSTRTTL